MKRHRRTILVIAAGLCLLVGLVVALGAGPAADIPAGTGYSALDLCTRTNVMGQPFDFVRRAYVEPKVSFLPRIWELKVVPQQEVTVRTRLPQLEYPRTARYRPGVGCTILAPDGAPLAPITAEPRVPARPGPWPAGEGPAVAPPAALKDVIARHSTIIFDQDSGSNRESHTTALLVALKGQLIHEQYGDGLNRNRPQLGWSMTKTITALIIGAMVGDDKLALDEPVGLAQWVGTDRAAITWRHLLTMSPGLEWFEGYGGTSDATEMLFSEPNEGAFAAAKPLVATPGNTFNYSTGTANIAMLGMREHLGGDPQGLYDYYRARLWKPLGIRDGFIEPDGSGTPVGGSRGLLRPVDWLRLGQLIANGGRWFGKTVIPEDFIHFMREPSPAEPAYGGSLWRWPSEYLPDVYRKRIPKNTVWMAGHLGQYLVIVPDANLLVLRLGVAQEYARSRAQVFAFVADLLDGSAL